MRQLRHKLSVKVVIYPRRPGDNSQAALDVLPGDI